MNQGNQDPPKPAALDYASMPTGPRLSRLAIVAFILGVISGPMAVGLVVAWDRFNHYYSDGIIRYILFAVCVPTLIICITAIIRAKRAKERLKGRILATIGLVACIVWAVLIPILV